MKYYNGKNIWIIGASSGIGAALARELSERGARVAISARREEKLKKVSDTLTGAGHVILPLDVTDDKKIDQHIATLKEKWGHIDSVVFLAAIYSAHDGKPKDLSFVHKMLDVNIGGAFNIGHKMRAHFEDKPYGQIVLCGSIAGYRGLPQGQPYCATKAAIISYAESLKVEVEKDKTDVKLICPGFVETPLTDKNDFDMPFIISAEKAAKHIANGMTGRGFEIRFPWFFTMLVKSLSYLPYPLYFLIAKKMITKTKL